MNGVSSLAFAPPGLLLFMRQETLMAQPFDLDKLQTLGDAVSVTAGVARLGRAGGGAAFSVSNTGLLAWRGGSATSMRLVSFGRDGVRDGTIK
jgi:hypothetical protein